MRHAVYAGRISASNCCTRAAEDHCEGAAAHWGNVASSSERPGIRSELARAHNDTACGASVLVRARRLVLGRGLGPRERLYTAIRYFLVLGAETAMLQRQKTPLVVARRGRGRAPMVMSRVAEAATTSCRLAPGGAEPAPGSGRPATASSPRPPAAPGGDDPHYGIRRWWFANPRRRSCG
jgi:hypothetical protein